MAYQKLKKIAHSGIVSIQNFVDDPTNIFTAHEMIGTIDGSTATKFTVHYNLFGTFIFNFRWKYCSFTYLKTQIYF